MNRCGSRVGLVAQVYIYIYSMGCSCIVVFSFYVYSRLYM